MCVYSCGHAGGKWIASGHDIRSGGIRATLFYPLHHCSGNTQSHSLPLAAGIPVAEHDNARLIFKEPLNRISRQTPQRSDLRDREVFLGTIVHEWVFFCYWRLPFALDLGKLYEFFDVLLGEEIRRGCARHRIGS